jgi:hypothetical protein
MADRRDNTAGFSSEGRDTNMGAARYACLANSKTDRRAHPKDRGVGDLPHSGINGIDHAAARAKDVLEIGLNDPARTDLRLIVTSRASS